jgi:hypothetical protein
MQEFFDRHGLPACGLWDGRTSREVRNAGSWLSSAVTCAALRNRRLKSIEFRVDRCCSFVDRRRAAISVQQLGRGLRHHRTKGCLTVLDLSARAISSSGSTCGQATSGRRGTRRVIQTALEGGFPDCRRGCAISSESSRARGRARELRLCVVILGSNCRRRDPNSTWKPVAGGRYTLEDGYKVDGNVSRSSVASEFLSTTP